MECGAFDGFSQLSNCWTPTDKRKSSSINYWTSTDKRTFSPYQSIKESKKVRGCRALYRPSWGAPIGRMVEGGDAVTSRSRIKT